MSDNLFGVVLVSAIFQSSPLILLTIENSGIKSIKDFKGKNIMLTPDTINSVTFNAMMSKENISFNELHIQEHSFDIKDLLDGRTDLFQSYITNEPYALKKAGITPIIFDPKDYGFDFYSDILFTSENEIKKHKQRVMAFRDATLRGWRYAFENIEESILIIHKKYNSQNRSIEALHYEAIESKKLAYYDVEDIGDISLHKLNRMYDVYNILNIINTPIDVKKYFIETDYEWQIPLTQQEKEYLKKHPILTISNEKDYPPYDYFEDGIPKGYSIDLVKLIANKLGVRVQFDTDNWNNLVKKFCDGKIDILHPTDKSKQVVECGEFTTPIIKDTSQFLLRNDFKEVKTLKDLYGYTIATPTGWQQTEEFKKNYSDRLKIIEVSNTLEAIEKVRAGEADFVFDYGNVLRFLKLKHNFNGLKVEGVYTENSSLDDLYIAVNKNSKILKNIFQKGFDSLSIKEKETLQNRWFGGSNNSLKVILSNQEKEFIRKHPTVKIGYSTLSQPLIIKSKDNSSVKGFIVDLANI